MKSVSEGLTLVDVENELEVTQTISSSYMKTRLSTSDFTPMSLLTLILQSNLYITATIGT